MPLVSIILPTYNGNKKWLSESIKSVLNQNFVNFELIIINDASTNNIEKTIIDFMKIDKRIVYIKNKNNLKLTKTLNKGINKSIGKYIARIDDDDIWIDKYKLEKQVNFMEKNSEYGICGTQINLIYSSGKIFDKINHPEDDKKIRDKILSGCRFFHSSIIIRKKAIEELGSYSTEWDYIEDYELWLRIGTKYKFKNLSDYSINYRVNQNGISYSNTLKQRKLSIKVCSKYRNYYPNFYKSYIFHLYLFSISFIVSILKKMKIYEIIYKIILNKKYPI